MRSHFVGCFSLLVTSLLASGCGHVETHRSLFRAPLPPVKSTELVMDTVPARTFAEVGLVQVIGHGNRSDVTSVLDALRREGQQMGCDAVVKTRFNEGGTISHAIGVCVVWVE